MSSQTVQCNISEWEYNAKIKENEDLRKRIDVLKQQVRSLKHRCTALEKWKRESKTKWDVERKNFQMNKKQTDSELVSMEQVKQFLAEYGGLSRYTIVDDDWHAKHPKAANNLLGFKTWEEGKQIMKMQFPDLVQMVPKLYLSRNSKRLQLETGTTLFERCVAVKLMERLGLAASKCGSIYSADERTVKSWRSDWQKKWGIDEIKVFQCQPLLGPSAVKRRKIMNEMVAAEIAAQSKTEETQRDHQQHSNNHSFLSRIPMSQDPSQQRTIHTLVNTTQDDFLIDREIMHREALERHDGLVPEPSYMTQETTPQPPLPAAVAAFIRNDNQEQPYRGPYETGGYYG